MIIVRIRHVRAAKICTAGVRQWFTTQGLDWSDFLENGMAADRVRELDSPFANRALAEAEREAGEV